ncbi:MAG: uracil-DNA glycosylase [Legionellales bacterium]|nr:uracil-DNA glycosylase [Legionellales bacterium]
MNLSMSQIHPEWRNIVLSATAQMDQEYLSNISTQNNIIPNKDHIFNAFTIPISKVQYILLGESPYPRIDSANGYAFWDAKVKKLWSTSGLTKEVNRATSLRNFIKMLLISSGKLSPLDTSQTAISKINKTNMINTLTELFNCLLDNGFLLLNATLVLSGESVKKDAINWRPFIEYIICQVYKSNNNTKLILFGKIAKEILSMDIPDMQKLCAEHPYNISFINNPNVLAFFKPLILLNKKP